MESGRLATSPAEDTRFGSSNSTEIEPSVREGFTPEMPLRVETPIFRGCSLTNHPNA
jgi:hypothetical protein